MLSVKFSSTYKEWDSMGNTRELTNTFEAQGDLSEIIPLVNSLTYNKTLPGTIPLNSLNTVNRVLLDYK